MWYLLLIITVRYVTSCRFKVQLYNPSELRRLYLYLFTQPSPQHSALSSCHDRWHIEQSSFSNHLSLAECLFSTPTCSHVSPISLRSFIRHLFFFHVFFSLPLFIFPSTTPQLTCNHIFIHSTDPFQPWQTSRADSVWWHFHPNLIQTVLHCSIPLPIQTCFLPPYSDRSLAYSLRLFLQFICHRVICRWERSFSFSWRPDHFRSVQFIMSLIQRCIQGKTRLANPFH